MVANFVVRGQFHYEAAKKEKERRDKILTEFRLNPFGDNYGSLSEASGDCLASSQAEVLARLFNRENVFISGPAGSGKTTIIRKFIDIIDAVYNGQFNVAVTASTGMAASLIDGSTIHKWTGLGVSEEKFNPRSKTSYYLQRNNMKYVDVLIIDEISMLHAYYLDNIDAALKHVRRNSEPFGGVQIVLIGDFMQLPPVPSKNKVEGLKYGYAITSDAWKNADIKHLYLDKVHRAEDEDLKTILKAIEKNQVDQDIVDKVKSLKNNKKDPTKNYSVLYTVNKNVDEYNKQKLAQNPNPSVYFSFNKSVGNDKDSDAFIKEQKIPKMLELKKDAVVIVTKNIHDGFLYGDKASTSIIPNGSVGRVVSIEKNCVHVRLNSGQTAVIYRHMYEKKTKEETQYVDKNGKKEKFFINKTTVLIEQFPLALGYAITVHKSQGQTFDGVEVDLSNCFSPGIGYVALSRVKNLDSLIVTGLSTKAFNVYSSSQKIAKYVKKQSLINRKNLLDDESFYESFFVNDVALDVMWSVSDSGTQRMVRDGK